MQDASGSPKGPQAHVEALTLDASERAASMRRRIRPLVAELVRRAQAEGTLRADFTPQDVTLLFWACDRAIELPAQVAPEVWRRQLGFLLDGLRPTAATPLPHPPLTDEQLGLGA